MKIATSLLALAAGAQTAAGFLAATPTCQHQSAAASTTARTMGLFDFFNEDARKEREERREREIEEQMAAQREIIARRANPDKMEEYEAKVRVRRALRMAGDDEAADSVDMYDGEDPKIVGLN